MRRYGATSEYLPAGDMALTRRATKYSSTSRRLWCDSAARAAATSGKAFWWRLTAIEKAEAECTSDADDRAKARARAAKLRVAQDQELVQQMTARILALFPRCTPQEARAIAAHTATRGSGRVGRSQAGRNLEDRAFFAAVAAAVRHNHTNYDEAAGERSGPRIRSQHASADRYRKFWRMAGGKSRGREMNYRGQIHRGIAAEESPRHELESRRSVRGITGQSSGRGLCVIPMLYHSTTS